VSNRTYCVRCVPGNSVICLISQSECSCNAGKAPGESPVQIIVCQEYWYLEHSLPDPCQKWRCEWKLCNNIYLNISLSKTRKIRRYCLILWTLYCVVPPWPSIRVGEGEIGDSIAQLYTSHRLSDSSIIRQIVLWDRRYDRATINRPIHL